MNLSHIMNRAGRMLSDNAPEILTVLGAAGTVTTAWLTGRAAWDVSRSVVSEELENREMTSRELVEEYWQEFIPAIATGAGTITCIVLANRIESKRAAALATGYTILREATTEYRAKVVEKLGEKKEKEIRDEISRDRVNAVTSGPIVVSTEEGKQLVYDEYFERFFYSTMEDLKRAENNMNKEILAQNFAVMGHFYNNLNWSAPQVAQQIGWNTDNFFELKTTSMLVEEGQYKGKTALVFRFGTVPVNEPWHFPR